MNEAIPGAEAVPIKYGTIVADPPWKVSTGRTIGRYEIKDGKQIFGVVNNFSRHLPYQGMTVDEIKSLPVSEFSSSASHLYLWTINRYLREAFDVMKSWGFVYSTTLVWAKKPMGGGLGGCYGLSTEFILFGRRGISPAKTRIGKNWFDWKRPYDSRGKPKHSAKPDQFYQMVEDISSGPYLELFARSPRSGWHVWGNEVESDLKMERLWANL